VSGFRVRVRVGSRVFGFGFGLGLGLTFEGEAKGQVPSSVMVQRGLHSGHQERNVLGVTVGVSKVVSQSFA
jgi:hypothetical protein